MKLSIISLLSLLPLSSTFVVSPTVTARNMKLFAADPETDTELEETKVKLEVRTRQPTAD